MAAARDGWSDLDADLGEIDGIAVILDAVGFADGAIVVHLRARRSMRRDELDAGFQAAFANWEQVASAARERGERPPDPPPQPGALLNAIALRLHDDAGTSYRWLGSQAAGTGTEWDAIRRFGPQPPAEATRLTLTLGDATGGYSLSI
jgi:hypothetical protein